MWLRGNRRERHEDDEFVPSANATATPLVVNGMRIDVSSPEGHHIAAVLAEQGALTEQHVVQTTRNANPAQQKQIMELLLQRKAGALSDTDFAAAVLQVMKPA
jgi:hypothetical protein